MNQVVLSHTWVGSHVMVLFHGAFSSPGAWIDTAQGRFADKVPSRVLPHGRMPFRRKWSVSSLYCSFLNADAGPKRSRLPTGDVPNTTGKFPNSAAKPCSLRQSQSSIAMLHL